MPATKSPKTYMAKKEDVQPDWYVLDVDGMIVGRLATKLATMLMGKHKPTYTPHVDCGDCIIILNADRVRFSGKPVAHPDHQYYTKKTAQKTYAHYTGYPGGRRVEAAEKLLSKHPHRILREAVRRMLPKNKLSRQMLKKLKLYVGTEHPHQAQQPKEFPAYLRP